MIVGEYPLLELERSCRRKISKRGESILALLATAVSELQRCVGAGIDYWGERPMSA